MCILGTSLECSREQIAKMHSLCRERTQGKGTRVSLAGLRSIQSVFHSVGEVAAIVPQTDDWISSGVVIADNAQRSRTEKKMATGIRRQA